MWWELFLVVYVIIGLTISVKHKSKERFLIDQTGDHLFIILAWLPVWVVVCCYNLKGKLVEWWNY